jgi:hypothetical protein
LIRNQAGYYHINTHTKTRELGYLVRIIREVSRRQLTFEELKSSLEKWSKDNFDHLKEHQKSQGLKRARGAIKKNTKSAERYITLTDEMQVIGKIEQGYELTKYGKVISMLPQSKNNPFELTIEERILLLKQILLTDTVYFIPFLKLFCKKIILPVFQPNLDKI